jgi:dihydroneopterin aldolase
MDIVYIKALRVDAVIGVFEWERGIRQPVLIDLDMAVDCAPAAENDDIRLALDYASVSERITRLVSESGFQLVEALAEKIATEIIDAFAVAWVRVKVGKPNAVLNAAEVGVIIERGAKH